ncbi:MAG: RedB [Phycisphaera sp. RhM]|nr:RedB [Phycisphaera sp. RhM]
MNSRPILLMTFVALFSMSAIGFIQLTDYSSRPGRAGQAPRQLTSLASFDASWTADVPVGEMPTLLFFYHPKCPCTAATVRVLERLHPRFQPTLRIIAVAYCPPEQDDAWIASRTTTALTSLTGTQTVIDRGGKLSERFGALVSGHLLLYDAGGRLTFSGGITPYRGHEGDSPSSLDLLRRINDQPDGCGQWPVFGCSIVSDREPQR